MCWSRTIGQMSTRKKSNLSWTTLFQRFVSTGKMCCQIYLESITKHYLQTQRTIEGFVLLTKNLEFHWTSRGYIKAYFVICITSTTKTNVTTTLQTNLGNNCFSSFVFVPRCKNYKCLRDTIRKTDFLGDILGAIGGAGHEGESLLHLLAFIRRVD